MRPQLERADTRLAYVQHPFPAQGVTTDTTHLIVADHATREGTYVGLTRARQSTDIYASPERSGPETDPLATISEAVGRAEPELPSIATPLAREREVVPDTSSPIMEQVATDDPECEVEASIEQDFGWEM